jgi:hypothetical protein
MIDPQEKQQTVESKTKSIPSLFKSIFIQFPQFNIIVAIRGFIEISANDEGFFNVLNKKSIH